MMNTPLLEVCVDSHASSLTAVRGGADRLELCGHLAIGGVTPSPVLFQQIRRDCDVRIHVLIRPRFGDFLYSDAEIEEMCGEIELFRDLGADGVVTGVLTPDGALDRARMERLTACAGGMSVTLHRAFDMARDPFDTLEAAVELGCQTILTSGQTSGAAEGRELLRALYARAAGRVDIMAGCGVNRANIRELHDYTGIRVFHASCRRSADSGMRFRRSSVSMGLPSLSEYELWHADEEEVRSCARIVHGLAGASAPPPICHS